MLVLKQGAVLAEAVLRDDAIAGLTTCNLDGIPRAYSFANAKYISDRLIGVPFSACWFKEARSKSTFFEIIGPKATTLRLLKNGLSASLLFRCNS